MNGVNHFGICRLCKLHKELSFEHIPPKAAFNKNTRYFSMSQEEYYRIADIFNYNHKGFINQGGLGSYCLCKECNSFLGSNYVRPYIEWVNIGASANKILSSNKSNQIRVDLKNLNPLRILKQIVSMFICINDSTFTDHFPELLQFVKHPQSKNLSDKRNHTVDIGLVKLPTYYAVPLDYRIKEEIEGSINIYK